jgi:hypothetical protein
MTSLFETLAATKPGSRKAAEAKRELQHAIFEVLTGKGIRAVGQLIASLEKSGVDLALADKSEGRRAWKIDVAGGKRGIELTIARNRFYHFASIQYREKGVPRMTPKQRAIHALQEAFYTRYMEAARKADRAPGYKPTSPERLILLVGDLEGGVNNGGFGTYLFNKGPRTARAAAVALRKIGADRTARMLEKAMAPGVTPKQVAVLDDRFYAASEDLAVLAARHLDLAIESA